MRQLSDRRETSDGRRPSARHLGDDVAHRHPLVAFRLLDSGDLFDGGGDRADGLRAAATAVDATIRLDERDALAARVRGDMIRQLAGNPRLAARMAAAKPIRVDMVATAREMVARGYPRSVSAHAAGMFWDHPDWPAARIAFRRDRLEAPEGRSLVVHEYAHAIHYLGFTEKERAVVERALRPVFGHPADQDEVFAIYSEREFLDRETFSALERAAPGVYGLCRSQWSEEHAFAAFVKKLYRPAAKIRAGDRERAAALKWRAFSGG